MPRTVISTSWLLVALTAGAAEAQTITVDPATTYQTMNGWEATAYVAEPNDPAFPNFKAEVYDRLINDLGINRLRLEVRSGVEHTDDNWAAYQAGDIDYQTWRNTRYATVNDNGDPATIDPAGFHFSELDWHIENIVVPLRALAQARGESLYINLCYVAFTAQIVGGTYLHDDPAEYAEFVLATYQHMDSTYGFVPDAWEVILEPDNVSQWNGTLIGNAIVAAAQRLSAAGYTPRFVAPSNTNMGNAVSYFDDAVQVSGALDYLVELSYHRYGGVSLTNLQAIASRSVSNGIGASMLEWWFGNATHHVLHEDVETGMNTAWQGATIRGLFEIDDTNPSAPVVTVDDVTKFTRQYTKFVRRGAVRVGATSSDASFAPLGFVNADGGAVVVIDADSGGTLTVDGLPAGIYGIKYTTGNGQTAVDYDVDAADQVVVTGASLTAGIPAQGVLTIYAKVLPAVDAGPEEADAGTSQADANPTAPDASAGVDAAPANGNGDDGCSCAARGTDRASTLGAVVLLLVVLCGLTRRRDPLRR